MRDPDYMPVGEYLHRPVVSTEGAELLLSKAARAIAHRSDVLFHGTCATKAILERGFLAASWYTAAPTISFSRSASVAAHFALLPRGHRRPVPAIFVFDRRKLQSRYRVDPTHAWDCPAIGVSDEMEEEVWGRDILNVRQFLVGIVALPDGEKVLERWVSPPKDVRQARGPVWAPRATSGNWVKA